MLIDTHCHVNFSAYKDDYKEVIARCLEKDIWLVNIGSQLSTSLRAVEIAEMYDQGVYAVVGLHPVHLYNIEVDEFEQDIHFSSRSENFDTIEYEKLLQHKKVVGIGEMGIDYFHLPKDEALIVVKQKQKDVFLKGIRLAQKYNLPYIVHTRSSKGTYDAYDDVIAIIKEANYFKGVVHCYGGNLEQVIQILDLGLYIGFTGIITFKNAKDLQTIACAVPLEKLLLETDSPYLTPEPFRGKRNEPMHVQYVAKKIAELRGVSYDTVTDMTTQSAKNLFNL
jgi:TatD DNase family protein